MCEDADGLPVWPAAHGAWSLLAVRGQPLGSIFWSSHDGWSLDSSCIHRRHSFTLGLEPQHRIGNLALLAAFFSFKVPKKGHPVYEEMLKRAAQISEDCGASF